MMNAPLAPAVKITGLEKSYGAYKVLHSISLSANQGEVVSILGASGSGKSTLLRCINMLEVPDAGEISIHGESYRLTQRSGFAPRVADPKQLLRLRSQATMVFQSFNLWSHLTILENLIEAPVHVQSASAPNASRRPKPSSSGWGSPTSATSIRRIFPAASSNVRRLPAHSPCDPRSCCSMNRRRHSIRNWSPRC